MDYTFSPEDEAFRQQLRQWLKANVDPGWREHCGSDTAKLAAVQRDWDRRLYAGGWAGIWWPKEFGGMGATPSQKVIFAQEIAEAGAPEGQAKLGKRLLGPILMRYGSPAQKERLLPRILCADDVWCQGFSEPDAGSDLAGLRTRAELRGDHFIINGQKSWTSHATYSDWCFILARTDSASSRQDGISLILVKLDTPGITVRPIKQINELHEFSEVFYDNVRVPAENLVGNLHDGWMVAMSILAYERGAEMAFGRFVEVRRTVDDIIDTLRKTGKGNPAEIGRLCSRVFAIQLNAFRLLSRELQGQPPNELSSVVKLFSTETYRLAGDLALTTTGIDGFLKGHGEGLSHYLESRHYTISAGASEIQRNVIARRVLGLPSSR